MDSNLSRLYFMLGNYDDDEEALEVPLEDPSILAPNKAQRKKCKTKPSASAESDTLLLNGSSVSSQIVVVELPPPRPKPTQNSIDPPPPLIVSQCDSPTAATLDISSSTTIINPHANHHQNSAFPSLIHQQQQHNSNEMAPNVKKSRTNSIENPMAVQQTQNLIKQPSVELHFNPLYTISDGGGEPTQNRDIPHHSPSPSILPGVGFRFPNAPNYTPAHQPTQSYNQHLLLFGQPPPPKDQYGLIYMALLLAGIGFLLPYNSFVLAADYFQHRFPSTTIVFDMSTTYILVAFITVIINNSVVECIPLFWRLNLGYLISLFIMVLVALYEVWAEMGGYVPNLVLIGFASFGCTVQQSTFYGYTSMLPKKYTQAVMTGESAAGIFVSVNRIVTKFLYPHDEQYNTGLFFGISILVIVLCALIHIVILPKSDFVRYYILMCNNGVDVSTADMLHHRTRRRRSKHSESDAGNAARMMHQINENLGLVQMYNQRSQQQLQNTIGANHLGRPSIYSTGSQMYLDAMIVEANPNGSSHSNLHTNNNSANHGLNRKVQNILRTDSMESVLPFGIDDEEIAVAEQEQLQQEQAVHQANDGPGILHNVPLTHQDSNGVDSMAGDFKTKSATSKMVMLLAWFENFTQFFRMLGIFCSRIRKCDSSFGQATHSLRRKICIRWCIIQQIWPHIVTISLVYFVTLMLFPGVESEVYSCYFHEWMPIILMTLFNVTDFVGKLLSTCFYRITSCQLLTVAGLRLLLIPAIALCVTPRLDPFFANPIWPILFTIAMGLTNGIFGSLPMILAPNKVHENMREIAGNLMTFSYIFGLTAGSFASYALHNWVDHHSPHLSGNYSYNTLADNCSTLFNNSWHDETNESFDRNALLQQLGNGSFQINASELLKNVHPELLQNSTAFSSSFYHF